MNSRGISLADPPPVRLAFHRMWVVRTLAAIVAVLTLLNLLSLYVRVYTHHEGSDLLTFIIYFFNTEAEWNLPAFYSAGALLLAGVMLLGVAWLSRASGAGNVRHWLGLGGIFIYMAADELCRIHEQLNDVVPGILSGVGIELPVWFKWVWVIPGAAAVLLIGLLYLRFVLRLPVRTRNLFLVSGAVYVGGALGMELVAVLMKRVQEHSVEVLLVSGLEECLEMTGVVLFIHAIMDYVARQWPQITVALEQSAPVTIPTPAPLPLERLSESGPRAA